jgi:uncharacterized protein
MRFDLVAPLLFLLAGLAATPAIPQDAASPESRNPPCAIATISVAERADAVAVEISLSQMVHAKVSTLDHPDRLAFDFPGCELAHPGQRLIVNRGSVIAVRAAQFSIAPPIARVVIDLKAAQHHEETYVGNKIIIQLRTAADAQNLAPLSRENTLAATIPPPAPKSDRPVPKSSDKAPPQPTPKISTPPSPSAPTAAAQPHAYALLAKARALTIFDLEPLEARSQAGDPESETTLALAYHAGTLLKQDDAEALRLLQSAANRGFVAAEESMGIFCQSGFGMPPDKAQAVSWYTKAAQHGSTDAATNLALMYSTGDGIPKDAAKAATWFRKAAEEGDATAQLNLAAIYHRGDGVPQDNAQTALWLSKAADQGLLPAMVELAYWDLQPEHGSNVDAAIGWYKKAAEQGDATSQAALGDILASEKLGRLDYPQALDWYRKAADQGDRNGEFGLGRRYFLGQGVPKDMEEARRWLTPAANQGHPFAQFLLATMFEVGQGGPVDAAAAAKYYELSAKSGLARAQYRFGLLLASDRGNTANLVSAYKWLVLAEDSEKESAATAEEVRKLLTPAQIAQAEHEIDEWRTTHRTRPSSR